MSFPPLPPSTPITSQVCVCVCVRGGGAAVMNINVLLFDWKEVDPSSGGWSNVLPPAPALLRAGVSGSHGKKFQGFRWAGRHGNAGNLLPRWPVPWPAADRSWLPLDSTIAGDAARVWLEFCHCRHWVVRDSILDSDSSAPLISFWYHSGGRICLSSFWIKSPCFKGTTAVDLYSIIKTERKKKNSRVTDCEASGTTGTRQFSDANDLCCRQEEPQQLKWNDS